MFSRVGIPQEILTDQGTVFLSNTLKQVYRLLGIKGIRTTPYHPQTDGLVERYNQTLKGMLRKFVAANGKDWDRWLPYLMFAYREVPQASTGFSPPSQQLLVQAVREEEDTPEQFFPTDRPAGELDFSHLTSQQQLEIQAIIPDGLFSEQPGNTSLTEHPIRLKDFTPVRQRMYRVPERLLPALQEELQVMQRLGVIERSSSAWSSPVVMVPKKDGSMRFCIDFRRVNAQSHFDAYPMPRLEDLIESVGKAHFISTLDLSKGYWQVPLAKEARPYSAFRTPHGLFQFTVMPFGLHGAPATFQRLMDHVLEGTGAFAGAYLDDIVVYSTTWAEHLQHLAEVFKRIHQAGLTVQPKKCAFAQQEVCYLGHVVGCGVIQPQRDKVEAIRNCQQPKTKKDVRSFLGLAGWYRRFVPNFATRAAPLTDLTRKSGSVNVPWEEQHQKAFMDLKEALCSGPVLRSPDFEKPWTVQTDASGVGLGAVLLQGEGEQQRPVAYISRKLFPRETRYSAIELECLAVKWALDTFRYYLLGRDFVLETDHRALKWLGTMKDTNARITRWFLALQPFKFHVQHRAGKQNMVADFLSRHPGVEPPEVEGNVKRQPSFSRTHNM